MSIASGALICGAVITWSIQRSKAIEQKKLAEAAGICRRHAEQGDATAQYNLGSMYYHGKGVPQNYGEAFRWYDKAASQGDPEAEYALGYMRYHGQGAPQDYTEAIRWYKKGASQRDAWSEEGLGLAYYEGNGVPRDYAEGFSWFRKAAEHGNARAQFNLGSMYYDGEGVAQDYTKALYWYRKAADQGDAKAQDALRERPTTFTKAYLCTCLFGSLLLLVDSLLPRRSRRNRQQRVTALTGLLGFSWVGLTLYGFSHFGSLQTSVHANAFHFVKGVLAGVFGVMAISLIWARFPKIMLEVSGVLFVGFNAYAIAHHSAMRFIPAVQAYYSSNGWLVGMVGSSATLLWLTHRKSTRHEGHTNKSTLPPA